MPRVASDKENARKLKQARDRQYQSNPEVKAKKKERDRQYQQGKRDQRRLQRHEDPLAQLADIATQQRYLESENDPIDESMMVAPAMEEREMIDVGGVVEEDGEILENIEDGYSGGGFNHDYDEWEEGLSDNGRHCTVIINGRIQYKRGGTTQS